MNPNDEDMLIWFEAKRKARNVRRGRHRNALGVIPTSYFVKQFVLCAGGLWCSWMLAKWMVDTAVRFWLPH